MANIFQRRIAPGYAGGSLQEQLDEERRRQQAIVPPATPPPPTHPFAFVNNVAQNVQGLLQGTQQQPADLPVRPSPFRVPRIPQPLPSSGEIAGGTAEDRANIPTGPTGEVPESVRRQALGINPIVVDTSRYTSGMGAPPPVPVLRDPVTGKPNEKAYRSVGTPESPDWYNAVKDWEPHGAKRGFKNAMKAGLIAMAQAMATNPDNPLAAAAGGFGAGAIGATINPNFKNRLVRRQMLQNAGQDLGTQLGLAKEQAQIKGIGSLQDAREAQIVAVQGRLKASQSALEQRERLARARILVSQLSGREFDPADPAEKGFVEDFTRIFGYPPSKRESGSVLELREEYDADGHLQMTVYDRVKRTATNVPITPGTKSTGQVTRENQTAMAKETQDRTDRRHNQTLAARKAEYTAIAARAAAERGDTKEEHRLKRISEAAAIHGNLLGGQEMEKSEDDQTKLQGSAIVKVAQGSLQGYSDVYTRDAQGNYAPTKGKGRYEGKPPMARKNVAAAAKIMKMTEEDFEAYFADEGGRIREEQ